ncbi:MAG: hypothetical protein MJ192_05605 [Clostridia bacterium]|nr:hypothetical protein [Clostridia bacterium]
MKQKQTAPPAIRPDTRNRLLDALESKTCATCAGLADESGLGLMTVHRAVSELQCEGVLHRAKGPDPETGRTVTLYFPALSVPVLIVDLTADRFRARYLCGALTPEDDLTVERSRSGLMSCEDDLRRLMADTRRALTGRPTTLRPLLFLPDEQAGQPAAARLAAVLAEELSAGGGAVDPSAVTVFDAWTAHLYALAHDEAAKGRTSLLSITPNGCRLFLRKSVGDAWFHPPVSAPLTDALFRALTVSGGPDRAQTVRLCGLCAPEAVRLEIGGAVTEECGTVLREALPSAVPAVSRTSMKEAGTLMLARRMVWE